MQQTALSVINAPNEQSVVSIAFGENASTTTIFADHSTKTSGRAESKASLDVDMVSQSDIQPDSGARRLHDDRVDEEIGPYRAFFIIFGLTFITLTSSAATGLLTVGLPEIARKLNLSDGILLW